MKDVQSVYIQGACYARQAYIKSYLPLPLEQLPKIKAWEHAFDSVAPQQNTGILSNTNNRIVLEFDPNASEEIKTKQLVLGNCKLMDPKNEKNANFEVVMPKDDKSNYFSCDNVKGQIPAGQELTLAFKFKHPSVDAFIVMHV